MIALEMPTVAGASYHLGLGSQSRHWQGWMTLRESKARRRAGTCPIHRRNRTVCLKDLPPGHLQGRRGRAVCLKDPQPQAGHSRGRPVYLEDPLPGRSGKCRCRVGCLKDLLPGRLRQQELVATRPDVRDEPDASHG